MSDRWKQEREEDEEVELSAETPIGRLAAKGFRLADTIALLTLIGTVVLIVGGWQLIKISNDHLTETHESSTNFTKALRDSAMAQRMQTCILSTPENKREQEYMSANGFCRQMSSIP